MVKIQRTLVFVAAAVCAVASSASAKSHHKAAVTTTEKTTEDAVSDLLHQLEESGLLDLSGSQEAEVIETLDKLLSSGTGSEDAEETVKTPTSKPTTHMKKGHKSARRHKKSEEGETTEFASEEPTDAPVTDAPASDAPVDGSGSAAAGVTKYAHGQVTIGRGAKQSAEVSVKAIGQQEKKQNFTPEGYALVGSAIGAMVGAAVVALLVAVRRARAPVPADTLADGACDVSAAPEAQETEGDEAADVGTPGSDTETGDKLEGSV